jgi:MbtH protein
MQRDDDLCFVIANCEDELALWPAARAIPAGWRPLRERASRERCLSFLQQLETERRPRVLRRLLEGAMVHP